MPRFYHFIFRRWCDERTRVFHDLSFTVIKGSDALGGRFICSLSGSVQSLFTPTLRVSIFGRIRGLVLSHERYRDVI